MHAASFIMGELVVLLALCYIYNKSIVFCNFFGIDPNQS